MQNYMRTILSGLQNWINKRLHETVPETDKAHMQLIKDENGATSWEERTHYKEVTTQNVVNLEATELIGGDENGDGTLDGFYLLSPWLVDLAAGNTYEINYNGTTYECYAVDLSAIQVNAPAGVIALGNLDAMGVTGIEGSNTDAPFVLMGFPNTTGANMGGVYGAILPIDEVTAVTISVRGVVTTTTYKELEEGYLPEAVRNGAVKQIVITVDADGNITSDTDFETAWSMTSAQLQAAIAIQKSVSYMDMDMSQSPILVSKFDQASDFGFRWIQIQHQAYMYDTSDVMGSSHEIIKWYSDGSIVKDQYFIPGFTSSQFFSGNQRFPMLQGSTFRGVTAAELKSELGIVDPIAPVFVVTVDNVVNNVGTADKTFAEIKAAHDAGQVVVCKYLDNYHHLHMCDETKFIFIMNVCDGQIVWTRAFTITATEVSQTVGVVQIDDAINNAISAVLPTPSTADAGKILRVNSEGKYELVSLPNAEEATF